MKTETKHTPGPWKIHWNIGKRSELGVIASEETCIICTMSNAKAWPAEARANARLIAAAPDLLAACQAIQDGWDKNLTEPMKLINSAIAAATTDTK